MREAMCSNIIKKVSQKNIMTTQSQQKGSVSVDKMTGRLSKRPLVNHRDECSRRVCVLVGKLAWRLSRPRLAKNHMTVYSGHVIYFFASGQNGGTAVKTSTCRNNTYSALTGSL